MRPLGRSRWTPEDVRSRRASITYPPLLLGTSAITRVVADVVDLEPVHLFGLPDAAVFRQFNIYSLVDKLVRNGIVTKLSRNGHFDYKARTALIMNREHPVFAEMYGLVRAIVGQHRINPTDVSPAVSAMVHFPDPTATNLRLLFGAPQRTLAIVLAYLRPGIRLGTLARCIGVSQDGPHVVNTLVRNGILLDERSMPIGVNREHGVYRLVRLNQSHVWSPALAILIDRLVVLDPHFESKARTAEALEANSPKLGRPRALEDS